MLFFSYYLYGQVEVCCKVMDRLLTTTDDSVTYKCCCLSLLLREQVEVCCELLDRLLTATDDSLILHNYAEELKNGLSHPNIAVKCLCIKQVKLTIMMYQLIIYFLIG